MNVTEIEVFPQSLSSDLYGPVQGRVHHNDLLRLGGNNNSLEVKLT